eukprot:6608943-Ditylum_brightwellii.AAC.1
MESPAIYPETLFTLGFKSKYREVYDDDEVMSRLLLRNKLHLNQIWDTPGAKGPLRNYIKENGLGSDS